MTPFMRGFARELVLLLVLLLLLAVLWAREAHGQVEPVVTLHGQDATTLVKGAGRGQQIVTVSVWQSISDSQTPPVVISPSAFSLTPGESQVVRLRAHTPCNPDWRFVVFFQDPPLPALASVTTVVARITLAVRMISKVRCQ